MRTRKVLTGRLSKGLLITCCLLVASVVAALPAGAEPRVQATPQVAGGSLHERGIRTEEASPVAGVGAYTTVEKPAVGTDVLSGFSITIGTEFDSVSVGWEVNPGAWLDDEPHLVVNHMVDGVERGAVGLQMAQNPPIHFPGELLPITGTAEHFSVAHIDDKWVVYYAGPAFGYFVDSKWGGTFTEGTRTRWVGATRSSGETPCADMGNGKLGSRKKPLAATVTDIQVMRITDSGGILWGEPATFKSVRTGSETGYRAVVLNETRDIRYGGPGDC